MGVCMPEFEEIKLHGQVIGIIWRDTIAGDHGLWFACIAKPRAAVSARLPSRGVARDVIHNDWRKSFH